MRTDVTVVIPTHLRRDQLLETLASVLAQNDVAAPVVVVDDGAGVDGTPEAVAALDVPRVEVVVNDDNQGVSRARNAGLARVRTPWVAFSDDDDIWAPDKLCSMLEALDSTPDARWACSGAVEFDGAFRPLRVTAAPPSGDASAELGRGNAVPGGGSGLVVATDLAREVGGFDPDFAVIADWEFALRVSARAPMVAVTRPLVGYYAHPDGLMHDVRRYVREIELLRARPSADPGYPAVSLGPIWTGLIAVMALRVKDWPMVIRLAVRSLGAKQSAVHVIREFSHTVLRRIARRPLAPAPERPDAAAFPWLDGHTPRS